MNRDIIQKTRMCIATYVNLYGVMPRIPEMMEWTGESYEMIMALYTDDGIVTAEEAA